MASRIAVYRSGVIRKSWKWALISDNGRYLTGARGFNTKQAALKNIGLCRKFFKSDFVIEYPTTPRKFK